MAVKLNLGCGPKPFKGWINIDKSWNIYLYRVPLLKNLVLKSLLLIGWVTEDAIVHVIDYPPDLDLRRSDVRKGLKFDDTSVDCIYTSQMLEHLPRDTAIFVLQECYRVLEKGGVLRVVVPDLKVYVMRYINEENSFSNNDTPAVDKFMDDLMLQGIGDDRPMFYKLMCKRHQWMYDFESLAKRLYDCGFSKVKECDLGEGLLPDVQELERGYHELHSPVSVFVEAIK